MLDTTKTLSIIYIHYKNEEFLRKSILSLQGKMGKGVDFEILVSNNDEESTLDSFRNDFSSVKIINHRKNVGYGAGNNLGAKEAKGKYLWFLNADTEVIAPKMEIVRSVFEKDSAVGVVGSRLITLSGKNQEWSAGYEIGFWNLIRNNLGFPKSRSLWSSQMMKDVDWVSGASFFIARDLFFALQGFDEKIFMYFEDMDLCKRVRKTGRKVLYLPQSEVMHIGGGSFKNSEAQKKNYYDSQEYYFKKHKPYWQYAAVRILRKVFL